MSTPHADPIASNEAGAPSRPPRRASTLVAPLVLTGIAFASTVSLPAVDWRAPLVDAGPLLAAVALGVLALASSAGVGPTPAGRTLALVAFPAAIVGGIAWVGAPTPSPAAAAVAVLTWAVYLFVALSWSADAPTPGTKTQPIADRPAPPPPRVVWTRRAYYGTMTLGAVTLAVVAPTLGGDAVYREAYGDAALSAHVLVAVIGGALALGVVLGIMAPGLRRRPESGLPSARTTWTRAGVYLALAIALAVALARLSAA